MNPEQNQFNQVSLKNIDSEPFECIYNNQSYGFIMPDTVRVFPQLMADLFLKHMIDQVMNRSELNLGDKLKRNQLASRIVVNIVNAVQEAPKTQDDILREKVEQMNKPSDLELLMAQKNPQPTPQPAPPPPAQTPHHPPMPSTAPSDLGAALSSVSQEQQVLNPVAAAETTITSAANLVTEPVAPEQPVLTSESQEAETPADSPTQPVTAMRDVLTEYAKNTLYINTEDPKTKEAWSQMSDQQLAKELNYEGVV